MVRHGRTVSAPADLLGEGVVLASGAVDGSPLDLPPGVRVTLLPGAGGTEDPAAVSGVSGCNHYFSTMTVDGDAITFPAEGTGGTEMACEPGLMALESTYLAALPRVETGRWDGDRFTLAGDGVELVYAAVEAVPTQDLVGTTWRLDSLLDGETASSTVAGADPATLELREDGTVAGGTGCRTLTGRYEVVADEVLLTELAAEGECSGRLGRAGRPRGRGARRRVHRRRRRGFPGGVEQPRRPRPGLPRALTAPRAGVATPWASG